MQHQRHVALRALPGAPARAAGEEVRPAAAVEQDDRLGRLLQRLVGDRVQRAALLAHVDDLDGRQALAVHARGQDDAAHRLKALGPRGGAARHDERAALLGDEPGVVARVALVLVGRVVLLVDDDQAEALDRGEHRRARAHAHARLAAAQAQPLVEALAVAERRVQDRDGVAEALDEARHDLRRQRDLGHQDDRPLPPLERRADGLQVHLGLARAGDAVQEQILGRSPDLGECRLLIAGQRHVLAHPDRDVLRRPALGSRHQGHQPTPLQPPQCGQIGPRKPRKRVQQLLLAFGDLALAARSLGPQRRLLAHPRRRQHQRDRPGERRAVLRGHPVGQPDGVLREAVGQHAARAHELVGRDVAVVGQPDHDARHLTAPERHPQQRPDADPLRCEIVERPAQRAGRGERLDAGDPRHRPSVEPYAASAFRASALSVFSQVKSWSSRPKWP